MAKVRLLDIATKIGVSSATVSMALSGKGNISESLRDQILRTAGDMGYSKRQSPKKINNQSRCLAILTYMNPAWAYLGKFTAPIYAQIESVSLKNDYYPIIVPITDYTTEKDIRETIIQSQATGIIAIHAYFEDLFEQMCRMGLPVVMVNNSSSQNKFHNICVDDYQGASDATQYLINMGHRNILYIDYWRPDQPSVVMDRFFGFKRSLDEHEIPFFDRNRIQIDIDEINELASSIRYALKINPEITAIFSHDDRLAIRIHSILKKEGLSIPEDISLIAPGDTLDYNLPYIPPITTMRIDTNLLGVLAGEQIIKHIETPPDELVTLKVAQQLVDRGSCRRI